MPGGYGNIRPSDNPKPFSSENQPAKRRGPSLLTKIKSLLENEGISRRHTFKGAHVLDEKGKATGEKVDVQVVLPAMDAIAYRYIEMMFNDPRIMRDYIDRVDGKAIDKDKMLDPDDENPAGFTIVLK